MPGGTHAHLRTHAWRSLLCSQCKEVAVDLFPADQRSIRALGLRDASPPGGRRGLDGREDRPSSPTIFFDDSLNETFLLWKGGGPRRPMGRTKCADGVPKWAVTAHFGTALCHDQFGTRRHTSGAALVEGRTAVGARRRPRDARGTQRVRLAVCSCGFSRQRFCSR